MQHIIHPELMAGIRIRHQLIQQYQVAISDLQAGISAAVRASLGGDVPDGAQLDVAKGVLSTPEVAPKPKGTGKKTAKVND